MYIDLVLVFFFFYYSLYLPQRNMLYHATGQNRIFVLFVHMIRISSCSCQYCTDFNLHCYTFINAVKISSVSSCVCIYIFKYSIIDLEDFRGVISIYVLWFLYLFVFFK